MEEIKTYKLQVGDIIGGQNPEKSLEYMIILHEAGYETCLHSYWNGQVCTALEIISLPKEESEWKVVIENDPTSL